MKDGHETSQPISARCKKGPKEKQGGKVKAKRGGLPSSGVFREGLSVEERMKLRQGADMERERSVPGRGNCMCKGPEVEKDWVCSR